MTRKKDPESSLGGQETIFRIQFNKKLMIIDYLGHSEFLVNIESSTGETVKILSDTWLSNYAFGDLMARNPSFHLDYEKLGNIDAIFISHAHCDHFDPYTLIEMQSKFEKLPVLLIPETIKFLVPLVEQYLGKFPYKILKNKEEISIKGIKIKGLVFENDYITNEDDVMTLFVYSERELVYTEVDTFPPEIDEIQNYIYEMFGAKKYESLVYLATRNELEGNIKLLDLNDVNKRKKFSSEYIKSRKEEIEWNYAKFEEGIAEYMDISKAKNFCKILIGQGIGYPSKLDSEAAKIYVLGLDELVCIEKSIMQKYTRHFPISYFEAGISYEIKNVKVEKLGKINYLTDFNFSKDSINLNANFKRFYLDGPLNDEKRDEKYQEEIILNFLNYRFLPYQIANLEDSMKNILLAKKSEYIVKITYGNSTQNEGSEAKKSGFTEKYYSFGFGSTSFKELENNTNYVDEEYYANDLEDFFNGTQELYSNFWHKLNPKLNYRLWTCLGVNFLNNDLVFKKYDFHFKRVTDGKGVDSFVENIYKKLK